ncbi:MAG: serine dehydratase beta chain, partial [Planctomycetota bacterium]
MISVFELFKIGVGPSSSHTVGPMIAACRFAREVLKQPQVLKRLDRVRVELYGSLALTGLGHATDTAIFCGLAGCLPDGTEVQVLKQTVELLRKNSMLKLAGEFEIPFDEKRDLIWLRNETLPDHPNAMQFSVIDAQGQVVFAKRYYSTGGGFVYDQQGLADLKQSLCKTEGSSDIAPYPFTTAAELIEMARASKLRIDQIIDANESVLRSEEQVAEQLDR